MRTSFVHPASLVVGPWRPFFGHFSPKKPGGSDVTSSLAGRRRRDRQAAAASSAAAASASEGEGEGEGGSVDGIDKQKQRWRRAGGGGAGGAAAGKAGSGSDSDTSGGLELAGREVLQPEVTLATGGRWRGRRSCSRKSRKRQRQ